MSRDSVEIRRYREGDERAITSGFGLFNRGALSLEEWNWAYPPCPEGRPIVVAEAAGELVAHAGAVAGRFQLAGRDVAAASMVDVYAVSGRGGFDPRDITTDVVEAFVDDFRGRHANGLVYRLRKGGASNGMPGATTADLPAVDLMVRQERSRSLTRRLAYRAEPARDWEPRLDELWQRVGESYPAAVVRDAEMAIRRHAGHPEIRRHRFLVFPRFSRHPAAYVVFEVADAVCRWVDLVWDHRAPGALDLAAHLSRQLAVQVGASAETVLLGGDPAGKARLEAAGFRSVERLDGCRLTVLAAPDGLEAADLAAGFYVTEVDLDPLRRGG